MHSFASSRLGYLGCGSGRRQNVPPPPVSPLSSDIASSLLESPQGCWGCLLRFPAASELFPDIVAALKFSVPIHLSFVSYSLTQYRVLVLGRPSFLQTLSDRVTKLPHVCDETRLVSPDIVSTGFPGRRYDRRDLLIARNKRMMGTH